MNITIGKKKYTLAYTFNSFKYMEDVDLSALDNVKSKPFKLIVLISDLFYGAMNYDKKDYYDKEICDTLLESYVAQEETDVIALAESLMNMLSETSFFKNLQEK